MYSYQFWRQETVAFYDIHIIWTKKFGHLDTFELSLLDHWMQIIFKYSYPENVLTQEKCGYPGYELVNYTRKHFTWFLFFLFWKVLF